MKRRSRAFGQLREIAGSSGAGDIQAALSVRIPVSDLPVLKRLGILEDQANQVHFFLHWPSLHLADLISHSCIRLSTMMLLRMLGSSIKHRNAFRSFSSYYLPDGPPIERGVPILYPLPVRLNI